MKTLLDKEKSPCIIELRDFIKTNQGTAMLPHLLQLQMEKIINVDNAYMAKVPNVGTFLVSIPAERTLCTITKETSDEARSMGSRGDLYSKHYFFDRNIFKLTKTGRLEDPVMITLNIKRTELAKPSKDGESSIVLHYLGEKIIDEENPLPELEYISCDVNPITSPIHFKNMCNLGLACIKSDPLFPLLKSNTISGEGQNISREELKQAAFRSRSFASLNENVHSK